MIKPAIAMKADNITRDLDEIYLLKFSELSLLFLVFLMID
jgi:hypothetical protein